jgi:hypothetical protein
LDANLGFGCTVWKEHAERKGDKGEAREVFAVSGSGSTWLWFGFEWVRRFIEGGADEGRWCGGG